jgi:hypothetical protein
MPDFTGVPLLCFCAGLRILLELSFEGSRAARTPKTREGNGSKRMKPKIGILATIVVLGLLTAVFAAAAVVQQSQDVLTAGTYTANVKALVCGGCGPLVKQTLMGMKQLDAVSVDSTKQTVQFTVKKNATVKLADIQKILKGAAAKMGMGADYTLSEVKPTK